MCMVKDDWHPPSMTGPGSHLEFFLKIQHLHGQKDDRVQSSFDHGHVESLKKNSRWEPGLSYWGSIIFWPWTCWIFKINSGWDSGLPYWGCQSSFWPCTCWIFKKNSRWDPSLSYLGGGGQSSFDHPHVESFKKIF